MMSRLRSWLRSTTHRRRTESGMDAELRFHMESYQQDLIDRGISRDDAMRRAHLEFGGVEGLKEACRESLGLRVWDELRGDIRYGLRALRQSPAFTLVAVLSLALGIGANTAIFSLANTVLYRTMNLPQEERLRLFSWAQGPQPAEVGDCWGTFDHDDAGEMTGTPFPHPLYLQMKAHNEAVDIAAFRDISGLSVTVGGQAESVKGMLVSGDFYQSMGVAVIAGRAITDSDNSVNAPGAVVISDAYWSRRFGRSAGALGKTISVNHVPLTIVGVNSPQFRGPVTGATPELFLPISLQPRVYPNPRGSLLTDRELWWVMMIGRLKPGVTDLAATTALAASFRTALLTTLPAKKPRDFPRFFLAPGARGLDQTSSSKKPIYLLLALTGTVLLIACVNLANLLLARSATRTREMSVRIALGASRFRVIRQVFTECMLLAFAGGGAGLLLGFVGGRALPKLFEQPWTASVSEVPLDWRVFAFTVVLTLITGILFGIAPAWRSTQIDANAGLKETGRMSVSRTKAFLGKSLVIVQVSLSMLLLVGAGLFVRTLINLKSTTLGLSPEHILLFNLEAPRTQYSPAQRIAFYDSVDRKLENLPGVYSVTLSSEALLSGSMENACYRPTGRAPRSKEDSPWRNLVGPGFFQTLGIPVIRGRSFTNQDRQGAPRVVVINQALAKRFFPGTNPIGQSIIACDADENSGLWRVVGVSADAKYSNMREAAPATIYLPYLQIKDVWGMTFELKTAASTASVVTEARNAVRSLDPDMPMTEIRTQTEQVDAALSNERMFATLTSGFGVLALMLACIGIYGIMAYTVSRRTSELGIRMALGAQSQQVLVMVLRETTILVCIGIAAGLAAAAALTRVVESLLYGVNASDPITYFSASGLLVLIALAAGFAPARRASSVDPMQALRHE